jgi:hypothetical protein
MSLPTEICLDASCRSQEVSHEKLSACLLILNKSKIIYKTEYIFNIYIYIYNQLSACNVMHVSDVALTNENP